MRSRKTRQNRWFSDNDDIKQTIREAKLSPDLIVKAFTLKTVNFYIAFSKQVPD